MRALRLSALLFGLAALGPTAEGCRSANPYDINGNEPERALLTVKNENFQDVDVYALSAGIATRVGTVSGLSSRSFALSPSLYSASDFRVIATPIGGNGRATSSPLIVSAGRTIEFTVGSRLPLSHAEVR